jgi:chromosome segregation protein
LQRRDELERQLSAVMAQYQEAAEELHRCEVRLAEAEAERTAMERRLLEEFGVTPEVAHAAAHQLEQKQSALDELERVRQEMAAMGEVRLGVLDEFERLNERVNFLSEQIADLETARVALLQQMTALEEQFKARFREVLEEVSHAFNEMVQRFWQGGEGRLVLTEGATLAESGVEVKVKLPGKAEQDLLSLIRGRESHRRLVLIVRLPKNQPDTFRLAGRSGCALR